MTHKMNPNLHILGNIKTENAIKNFLTRKCHIKTDKFSFSIYAQYEKISNFAMFFDPFFRN